MEVVSWETSHKQSLQIDPEFLFVSQQLAKGK